MSLVGLTSFLEMLGGLLLAIAILFAFLSIIPPLRATSLRLSGIVFLVALALFSNHWATYFAAIFIIATAVTELEFLHILAAIIRGDKNYFDYRREFLTRDEALQKSRKDAGITDESSAAEVEADQGTEKTLRIPRLETTNSSRIAATAFRLEDRALNWIEKKFGSPVQRYLRFRSEGKLVEVDGVIQGRIGQPDRVFEIKWIRSEQLQSGFYTRVVDQVAEITHRYRQITKREAELVLLLIVSDRTAVSQLLLEQLKQRLIDRGVRNQIFLVSLADLNVELSPNTEIPPAA